MEPTKVYDALGFGEESEEQEWRDTYVIDYDFNPELKLKEGNKDLKPEDLN
jgi:hypothetical protein